MSGSQRRPRGRPAGGGNSAEEIQEALLASAERLFISRGVKSTTMETIAHDAGYSRTAIYRQFPTRRDVIAALVQRTTQRHIVAMLQQMPQGIGPVDLLVESLVVVATQLVRDPLLHTIADHTPDGTVASLIARDGALVHNVEVMVAGMMSTGAASPFRSGLHPHDLAQFIIGTSLSMLMEVVPAVADPAAARRYIQTFILPAIVDDPPPPTRVFPDHQGERSAEISTESTG